MVECARRDLVCLHLAAIDVDRDRSPVPPAVTATGIGDALEVGDTAASRIRLIEDLTALQEDNLVTAVARPVAGYDAPRTVYFLTEAGRERASAVREEVRNESVVVTNGTTEEVPLASIDRYVDGETPLVTALARQTDDGRVPLERHVGEGFVGREDALATVQGAIEGSISRGSRTVVVSGAAGIGKTALVREAIDRVRADRTDLVEAWGDCSRGPTTPYGPVRQAFESVPDGGDLLATLADIRAAFTPDGPEQVATQRNALFTDVAADLRTAATERPVVLVLDNLQWADDATLSLFASLATTITEWIYPVVFVATYRSAAVAGNEHPLPDVLDRIEHEGIYSQVSLEPLSRTGTRALLSEIVGRQRLPDAFVDLVHELTGGVPMFVRETATHLLSTGVVDPARERYPRSTEAVTVPEAVTEQVDQRLSMLDEPSRDLLGLGAVVGEHVPGPVLAEASDLSPARRREYEDGLVAGLVWERVDDDGRTADVLAWDDIAPDGGGDVRFVSGVTREAVVDRLPAEAARRYHVRVADAVVDVYDDSDERAARIAHHLEQAGAHDRALRYYRRAGRYAEETYANEDAIANYERALSLATGSGVTAEETDGAIAGDIAGVYETKGEYDTALEMVERGLAVAPESSRARCRLLGIEAEIRAARAAYDRARETTRRQRDLAVDVDAPDLHAAALRRLGSLAVFQGEYDRAREHLERSLTEFRDVEDRRGEANSLHDLGDVARNQGEYDNAHEYYDCSLDIARELDDRRLEATSRKHLGTVASYRGENDRARECYEGSLAIARQLGDRELAAECLNNLGVVAYERDEYERARDYYERSLDIKRELGDTHGVAYSRNNLGLVAQELGEYDRAREHHERCLHVEREIGDRQGEANSLNNLGVVAQNQGAYDRARECFERSLAIAREIGDRQRTSQSLGNIGMVSERRGEYERAREYYEDSLAIKRELGDRQGEAIRLTNLGLVDVRQGEYDRARERCERALAIARELGEPLWEAQSLAHLGSTSRLQGEYDGACEYHEQELEIAREIGNRIRVVESLVELGLVAYRLGVLDEAHERFERALELARDLGSPRREARSRTGLGRIALDRCQYGTADDHLTQARELFERVGDPAGVARTRLVEGRLALARGDLETAAEHARAARESFEGLGATHWVGRSHLLLGRVATAAGSPGDAREHWRAALEVFEAVDAPQDALAALECLVQACHREDDDERAREWRRRGRTVLETAPEAAVATDGEWLDRFPPE